MSQRVADAFASLTPVAASPSSAEVCVSATSDDKENVVEDALRVDKGGRKRSARKSWSPHVGSRAKPQGRKFGTPLKSPNH